MEMILTLLFLFLAYIAYRHSTQIRELKWGLNLRAKELRNLKQQLADLKKKPDEDLSGQNAEAPVQAASAAADLSAEVLGDTRPPGAASVATPSSIVLPQPPEPVPQANRPGVPPEGVSGSAAKAETDRGIADRGFNWENFLGAKLFAWIGGFSLFIAFAFLLKYSFDHNLISPAVRIAMGFIGGMGLITGGMYLKKRTYAVTSQTLCATGIVVLYTASFAAHSVYNFWGSGFTFVLMTMITAGAFALAAGADAKVVAVLGMAGGFMTPPMLSAARYSPFALFSYVTLLNIGLLSVAFYRKWNFLAPLGAVGTILLQLYWTAAFFKPDKAWVAATVFLWFDILFCAAFWYARKVRRSDLWLACSAAALPFVTFLFALLLTLNPDTSVQPGVIFFCLLGGDLCFLAITWMERKLRQFHMAGGGCVFYILGLWIMARMTPDLLIWALGGTLLFALLHSAVPIITARVFSHERISWQMHLFPLLGVFLTLIPIVKGNGDSWLVWFFVLIFNSGILVLALFTASALAILAALLVTALLVTAWLFSAASSGANIVDAMILVGAFGIFFSIASTFVLNRLRQRVSQTGNPATGGVPGLLDITKADNLFFQIPALSALLPFMLLILASGRIVISNPASILGLGCVLAAIAVGLARFLKMPVLLPVAMGGFFVLETAVHLQHFNTAHVSVFLGFYLLAATVFYALPFYFKKDYLDTVVPWATAALSGPLHFFLIYGAVKRAFPNNFMGLLPALMAVPFFFGSTTLLNWIPEDSKKRNTILAWFGGATLFFVTLIFPVQFDYQWLTVGWALEGAALIWLFRKIPHPGLRGVGIALLLITFVRLTLNPDILVRYPHGTYPVFNWYLYTYGIAIFCMFAGGRLLSPPRNRAFGIRIPPVLFSLGTILAFLLMNIEIADLFSPGISLKFQFTGDLARGMAYSIAWALFALGLLVAGIRKKLYPVRLAAIGLIGVTLLKLFFFDLNRLDQLYRIGAFVGVAVVLIAASALYQKWVVRKE